MNDQRSAIERVLFSPGGALGEIVLGLRPAHLLELRRVSRRLASAVGATAAGSTGFAETHIRRLVTNALIAAQAATGSAVPISWDIVSRHHGLQAFEDLTYVDLAKQIEPRSDWVPDVVRETLESEPWPSLPPSYWAALCLLFKLDIHIICLLLGKKYLYFRPKNMQDLLAAVQQRLESERAGPMLFHIDYAAILGLLDDVFLLQEVEASLCERVFRTVAANVFCISIFLKLTELTRDSLSNLELTGMDRNSVIQPAVLTGALSLDQALEAADLNVVDFLLRFAASFGNVHAMKAMVKHQPPLNHGTRWLEHALRSAVLNGHVDAVSLLLSEGADANFNEHIEVLYSSPLHNAVHNGSTEIVRALLDHGASVDSRDGRNCSPLLTAARLGHTQAAELLLDAGADIEAGDGNGRHPLHLAAADGGSGTVRLLLAHGAHIDVADGDGRRPLHFAAERPAPESRTAASAAEASALSCLLDAGADIEAVSFINERPIHAAARFGNTAVLAALATRGARLDPTTSDGDTPLHLAARLGRAAAVAFLLDAAPATPSIERGNRRGAHPLHLAAAAGHAAVVQLLIERGASTAALDGAGCTPLMCARKFARKKVVALLLLQQQQENVDTPDDATG
ncbi:hypothetical protein HK405_010370 [Cladochytrium tenue]|nr:hypothetical protein HK405_010370 [Cladochytrium tenue]